MNEQAIAQAGKRAGAACNRGAGAGQAGQHGSVFLDGVSVPDKVNELPPRIHSFGPVADTDARILILGSMPGKASLRADQYYAYPHNHFWRILGELTGAGRELAYEDRLRKLKASGIALWDVLASCERDGSLDADIRTGSMQVNDFTDFFRRHSRLQRVVFNGATAATTFHRLVLPGLSAAHLELLRLPSTSPANAAMTYERKLQAWRQAIAGDRRDD